jgi:hypothetical protein
MPVREFSLNGKNESRISPENIPEFSAGGTFSMGISVMHDFASVLDEIGENAVRVEDSVCYAVRISNFFRSSALT